MAEQYLGEIRTFAFTFAPQGWAYCNGQTLSIQSSTALFALLGTTYGGNGTTNFQLPNLQSRFAIHFGQGAGLTNYIPGETGGAQTVTLGVTNLPAHNHLVNVADTPGTTANPTGAIHAQPSSGNPRPLVYSTASPDQTMAAGSISSTGGNIPFNIIPPYLCLNFCIALTGIFPSRN
jgi:microcystin-dependent protein